MTIYIKDNEEYTLEEIQSAAQKSGLDIDAYIEQQGFEISEKEENPVEVDVVENEEIKKPPVSFNEFVQSDKDDFDSITTERLAKEEKEIDELLADLIPEIPKEEKKDLPYPVTQNIIRNYNGKFTRENVDIELEKFNEVKADPFKGLKEGWEGDKKRWNEFLSYVGYDVGGQVEEAQFLKNIDASMDLVGSTIAEEWNNSKENRDARIRAMNKMKETKETAKPLPSFAGMLMDSMDKEKEPVKGTPISAAIGLLGDMAAVTESLGPIIGSALAGGSVGGPVGAVAGGFLAALQQMMPEFVYEYNLEKAKANYPDMPVEKAIANLVNDGEADFAIPLLGSSVTAGLAMLPMGKASRYLGLPKYSQKLSRKLGLDISKTNAGKNWLASNATKKRPSLFEVSNLEALQEVGEIFPQSANRSAGAGEDFQGLLQNIKNDLQNEALSTYARTFTGMYGTFGLARGTQNAFKNSRTSVVQSIDQGKAGNIIEDIGQLAMELTQTENNTEKDVINEKINSKQNELEGLVTRYNSILGMGTEEEFNRIDSMEELNDSYVLKVRGIHESKNKLTPAKYSEALETYRQKYLENKNRIKGIAEEIIDRHDSLTDEQKDERSVSFKMADNINKYNPNATPQQKTDFFNNVVIPNTEALVNRVTNRYFKQYRDYKEGALQRHDFYADLIVGTENNPASSLRGLYESYNPEKGQKLSTWIVQNLDLRARRILEERVGSQRTTAAQEIGAPETQQISDKTTDEVSLKAPKLAIRLDIAKEVLGKVRRAANKALSTALDIKDKKFTSELLNTVKDDVFKEIKDLIPSKAKREAYLTQYAQALYDAIPASGLAKANPELRSWLEQNPSKQRFVDYFLGKDEPGLNPSTKSDRINKQLPEYIAKALAAESIIDELQNNPDTKQRFEQSQKQAAEETADNIQDITKEERDLKNNNPEQLEELKRLATEGDAGNVNNILNTERISVDRNPENDYEKLTNRQERIINFIKIAKIPTAILEKAGFTNPGAEYTKRDGIKYYKLKNGKEVKDGTPEYKKALTDGLLVPARGGLFAARGRKKANGERVDADGLFLEAYNAARENDKLYSNLSSKRVTIKKGEKIDGSWLKRNAAQQKQNMDFLITTIKVLADAVHTHGLPIEDAFLFITSAYQATEGFIKVAAPFKYVSKVFAYGRSNNQQTGQMYREEHQPQASYIGKIIMWGIKYNKINLIEPFIRKNFYQTQLSKSDDQKFDDAKLAKNMPEGYTIFQDPVIRMSQAGVNLNDQVNIETGKTIAEEQNAKSEETPDGIAASNDVINEKQEDQVEALIDRVIGKLEEYLGPKGSLQASFSAVPTNILIGGLRTVKIAYKASKNLAEALQKGYSKVKDFMDESEWLDFANKAITNAKQIKNGSEVALAIANEKSIEIEKARQEKLKILKKANVYSKENENQTSEVLDNILKNADEQIKQSKKREGMDKNFRKILNQKKDEGGKPSKWFIPPNAEDIKGLLYAFLPKGKLGLKAREFFNTTILKPYSDGIAAAEAEILQKSKLFKELIKDIDLNKEVEGTPYNIGDAVRVYNWVKNDEDVDISKQEYIDRLVGAVEANPEVKNLADKINENFDVKYNKKWRNSNFKKNIFDAINSGTRAKNLEVFSENVDVVFNKDNIKEVEKVFGKKFAQSLNATLKRMKSGRNRVSTDANSNVYLNWINRAVSTTMFLNNRSASLQLLSSLNFIGLDDNNIFQATAAFANQAQWQKDYNTLWNSDYLLNRRKGAKFDVLADEIAEGDPKGLNKLLKFGFLPTRYADSFAIALGGAAFYRNRINSLVKNKGLSEQEASEIALKDWIKAAEESQQSADPSKISEIQASSTGKLIFAYQNTPFQYARIGKRKLQDITSGRSYAEGGMNKVRKDLQSFLYYTIGQSVVFNALQTALIAQMFMDDDDEEKLKDKELLAIERGMTSYAKSLGNPGAIAAVGYSMYSEASKQIDKFGRIDNPYKIALEATSISPPLNTKLRDIIAIGNIYKYNYKQIEKDPFKLSLDNPSLEIAGNAASFGGVPLDRVIRKAQNLQGALSEEAELWQRIFLINGWSKWDVGLDTKPKKKGPKIKGKGLKGGLKGSGLKKLKKGVAGVAHKDGTIEIAPDLSPKEKKLTMIHEQQHQIDMKSGKLNYDKKFVYYNGNKYARKSGKIMYNGKAYKEGDPDLPWEKRAYKAEKTKKFLYA